MVRFICCHGGIILTGKVYKEACPFPVLETGKREGEGEMEISVGVLSLFSGFAWMFHICSRTLSGGPVVAAEKTLLTF